MTDTGYLYNVSKGGIYHNAKALGSNPSNPSTLVSAPVGGKVVPVWMSIHTVRVSSTQTCQIVVRYQGTTTFIRNLKITNDQPQMFIDFGGSLYNLAVADTAVTATITGDKDSTLFYIHMGYYVVPT
jgi:hypothetical protein